MDIATIKDYLSRDEHQIVLRELPGMSDEEREFALEHLYGTPEEVAQRCWSYWMDQWFRDPQTDFAEWLIGPFGWLGDSFYMGWLLPRISDLFWKSKEVIPNRLGNALEHLLKQEFAEASALAGFNPLKAISEGEAEATPEFLSQTATDVAVEGISDESLKELCQYVRLVCEDYNHRRYKKWLLGAYLTAAAKVYDIPRKTFLQKEMASLRKFIESL